MLITFVQKPKPLTPKQRAVFEWLFSETLRNGYQPTTREVCEHMGWKSPHAAALHLEALAAKGWLRSCRISGASRALRFLRCPDGTPFHGLVPRTEPLEVTDV
jgi:repressor LexA